MNVAGSTSRLTQEELERSVSAESQKLFADVTPAQLFGPKSDGMLAADVRRAHPARYQSLKLAWRYEIKELRRPDYDDSSQTGIGGLAVDSF